jgi:signal transduction histidine kinase
MTSPEGRLPPVLAGSSLRWAMGLFCSFIGAFMLVAPHQFGARAFGAVRSFRTAWAIAALAAGVALLSVAALRTRRRQRLVAHGLASLVLLALGGGILFFSNGISAFPYMVLGAGLLSRNALRGRQPGAEAGDLLAFLNGIIATLAGGALLLVPSILRSPFPEDTGPPARHLVLLVAGAMLLSGPFLTYVQVRPVSRRALCAAHLAGGASLAAYGLLRTLMQPAWTVIFLYCATGAGVALLPWLRRWSAGFDGSALRTRLALSLAATTCVALVLAVAISTAQEERLATAQAQETLEVEARSVAQDVRDYLELNGARAVTLASLAGELPLSADVQGQLLAKSRPLYRDLRGLLMLGLDGRLIAADGGAALGAGTRAVIAAAAGASTASPVKLAADPISGQRLLLVAARVADRDARPLAALVMAFEVRALDSHMARTGSIVSLADGTGNPIAQINGLPGAVSLLRQGWDRGAAHGERPVLADRLLAVAPLTDFGWKVAIERPLGDALAGVNRGRDLAFALLLLVLPLAIAGGILVARLISRPLGSLADAVEELTAGNPWAPLERSTIGEVERLSAAFSEMRDRLAQRTAESERLAVELRARAEALAETDRRKDEFLAMLAHELRNPLGAISSAGYILAHSPAIAPPASRSVAVIQRQTLHLARLVDDLLDVSRITRGKVEMRRVPLDLGEVVRQALETTRPLVEARQHRIEVSVPAEPLRLVADPTRIEQVLANLIRNAVKFSEPGGVIAVDASAHGGWAVVRVRDSGVGIAGELLPRVFDLFTQGHQGLDRSAGGLGIGLTLVRSLVEMHGGYVQAESAGEGCGSEFIVWLPLASPAALREAEPAGANREAREVLG